MRHGYLRISTIDQTTARQEDGLRDLCDRLHVESPRSAVARSRPVFERLIARLQHGDVLVVWSLDRAFRSALDALTTIEKLYERGIGLEVVNLGIDLNSPVGRVFFTITAALDELERARLSERTSEGMAAARRRGVRLGRPPKLCADQKHRIITDVNAGRMTVVQAAKAYGVSDATIRRVLADETAKGGGT